MFRGSSALRKGTDKERKKFGLSLFRRGLRTWPRKSPNEIKSSTKEIKRILLHFITVLYAVRLSPLAASILPS